MASVGALLSASGWTAFLRRPSLYQSQRRVKPAKAKGGRAPPPSRSDQQSFAPTRGGRR